MSGLKFKGGDPGFGYYLFRTNSEGGACVRVCVCVCEGQWRLKLHFVASMAVEIEHFCGRYL